MAIKCFENSDILQYHYFLIDEIAKDFNFPSDKMITNPNKINTILGWIMAKYGEDNVEYDTDNVKIAEKEIKFKTSVNNYPDFKLYLIPNLKLKKNLEILENNRQYIRIIDDGVNYYSYIIFVDELLVDQYPLLVDKSYNFIESDFNNEEFRNDCDIFYRTKVLSLANMLKDIYKHSNLEEELSVLDEFGLPPKMCKDYNYTTLHYTDFRYAQMFSINDIALWSYFTYIYKQNPTDLWNFMKRIYMTYLISVPFIDFFSYNLDEIKEKVPKRILKVKIKADISLSLYKFVLEELNDIDSKCEKYLMFCSKLQMSYKELMTRKKESKK